MNFHNKCHDVLALISWLLLDICKLCILKVFSVYMVSSKYKVQSTCMLSVLYTTDMCIIPLLWHVWLVLVYSITAYVHVSYFSHSCTSGNFSWWQVSPPSERHVSVHPSWTCVHCPVHRDVGYHSWPALAPPPYTTNSHWVCIACFSLTV